ncbi:MAG: hypothetical protein KJ072_01375 [Verrucomicrobia bacterium]|nr:hypothetical protein [Verrucomicrobiota bacterium]
MRFRLAVPRVQVFPRSMRLAHRVSTAIACLLFLAPPACAEAALRVLRSQEGATNLLRNPGFEQTSNGQFTAWQSAPQGYRIAPGEGRTGSQALAVEANTDSVWVGAGQTLTLNRTSLAPLVVRGWSRAEQVSGGADSDYSIYVDLIYQDGTPLWGQTGNFRTGTHDWEPREFIIIPEKPVRSLALYCLFRRHTGKAWFDDVEVQEISAPAGSILFQGTPMTIVPWNTPAPGVTSNYVTGDGLALTLDDLRITSLKLDDLELAANVASGFLARDVATNSDVYPFANGHCAELGLRLNTTITAAPDHLAISGRITATGTNDRAIMLAFALPMDATDWRWHDDLRRQRLLESQGEFVHASTVGAGTTGTLSTYPLACVDNGQQGLALALDMGQPAQYRLLYHAGTRQLLIVFDLGLVPDTIRFPSAADFRFVLFRYAPRWGFRAAWQKFMEIFPDYFVVRSRQQGIWMPFTDVSTVNGWEDFGFRYHEGNNNVPFDDAHGILSFRYTEPMTWWMPMAPELPRTEETALRVRDDYANGTPGYHQQMAVVSQSAAMLDDAGHPALLFRNEPWANGAVWSLNPNPLLPANPNAATVHWNPTLREQLYGPGATGQLDGEYLDSLEGYVTANVNFRREHFAHSTVPLTFTLDTHRPALLKGLAVFEFTRWLSEDLHRMGKLCFANGVPYRFSFLCPWLDVMGTETDWLVNGQYQPASHAQMSLWRTLAGRKPYLLLMNTDYNQFGTNQVERYFQRSLFYGMFPSMFSHNAAENPYWRNPTWYERDRPLFKRYLPLIRQVAEAGWSPVTGATNSAPSVLIEKYGPAEDGTTYYTLFNDGTGYARGTFTLTDEPIETQTLLSTTELLGNQKLLWTGTGWAFALEPQSVAVVRLDVPALFRRVELDPSGRLRLQAAAAVGSAHALESSTDLNSWATHSTIAFQTSPMDLPIDITTTQPQEFYRLRLVTNR